MSCQFLRGLLAPRCVARDHFPVPSMLEETLFCLAGGERRCPHYRRALKDGRVPSAWGEEEPGCTEENWGT